MTEWSGEIYDDNTKFTTPLPDKNFLAPLPKSTKILDAGCGYGRTLCYLYSLGFHNLTGFDVSSDYINKAKKNCPQAEVFVSSFENFNSESKYDLILLMAIIEYISNDKQQEVFFKKISRNLSNNGYVLLETFIMDFRAGWRQYLVGFIKTLHFGRFKNSKGFECHHQTVGSLKKILKKHFIIESDKKKDYLTWNNSICKGHYFILKSQT